MSDEHIDEHEQGERVRKWLRDNGASVFGGIALGIGAILGVQFLQTREGAHQVEAARQYDRFVAAQDAGEGDSAAGIAAALATEYDETPYPALAALRRAAALVEAEKPDEALAALEAAIPGTRDAALKQTLQLRASRVEVIIGRNDAALARLAQVDMPALASLRHEIEGDALLLKGDRDGARDAYRQALTAMDSASPTRLLLELKLADVGGTTQTDA